MVAPEVALEVDVVKGLFLGEVVLLEGLLFVGELGVRLFLEALDVLVERVLEHLEGS